MDTKTILIVDDEESVLFVLRNSLLKIGHDYRILTATDGKNALKFFEKYQVDLVITDYRMSGMNGLELIETILSVQPQTRMILITGFGTDEIEAAAERLKLFAYLKKPIDLNTLRLTVRQALGDETPSDGEGTITKANINLYFKQMIEQLQREIDARCVLFANTEDKSCISAGQSDNAPAEQLISYISTSLAMVEKANEFFEDKNDADSWIIRRGTRENLVAGRVDASHLLIVMSDFHSQANRHREIDQIMAFAENLRNLQVDSEITTGKNKLFDGNFKQAMQSELDRLFTNSFDAIEPGGASRQTVLDNSFNLTYEEALSLGMILPNEENNTSENH
jgi:YesN/AraC family two-component response regulator